jgi:glycosyltransferase involved in cell wall biosynthesis
MANSLLLISGIFPPDTGGPAKFASEFSDWATSRGTKVSVITYANNIDVFQQKNFPSLTRVDRRYALAKRYMTMVDKIGQSAREGFVVMAVGAFLETFIASLVFRFSYIVKVPGDIVWERAKNNNLTTLDIKNFQNSKLNLKYSLFRFLYSQSLRRAEFVIVPSQGLFDLCLNWGVAREKIKLIFNSVDSIQLSGNLKPVSVYDLITVCRLVPWKGVDEVIRYAAKFDRSLIVVGDGPERAYLESLAISLNAKVVFTGDVNHSNVTELLSLSKLFVLNSYYEGLPHALIEARALGVPTVARSGTGSEEVVTDGKDGYLINANQSLDFVMEFAFQDADRWNFLCEQAKIDVKRRFDKKANFDRILRLIKDAHP